MPATSGNALYRVYDLPPFVTDNMEIVKDAKEDGLEVSKVKVTRR